MSKNCRMGGERRGGGGRGRREGKKDGGGERETERGREGGKKERREKEIERFDSHSIQLLSVRSLRDQ